MQRGNEIARSKRNCKKLFSERIKLNLNKQFLSLSKACEGITLASDIPISSSR